LHETLDQFNRPRSIATVEEEAQTLDKPREINGPSHCLSGPVEVWMSSRPERASTGRRDPFWREAEDDLHRAEDDADLRRGEEPEDVDLAPGADPVLSRLAHTSRSKAAAPRRVPGARCLTCDFGAVTNPRYDKTSRNRDKSFDFSMALFLHWRYPIFIVKPAKSRTRNHRKTFL